MMYENKWGVLDGSLFSDKKTAHRQIARALSFPSYYGNNLDALYDCLTEMGPAQIDLYSCAMIRRNLNSYGEKMLQVFRDAASENTNLLLNCYD